MIIKKDHMVKFFLATAVIGCAISYSSLYLFHFALALLVSFQILVVFKNNFKITRYTLPTKLHLFMPWMLFWYLCTLIWTQNFRSSVIYLFYIFLGLMIVVVMTRYGDDIDKQVKITKWLAVAFIVEILLSLLEVFTPLRLPVSAYSDYLSLFGRSVADVDPNLLKVSSTSSVPTGFQWNPNNLATTMLVIFPFFLLHNKPVVKCLGVISTLSIISATGSRGNIIAVCIVFLMFIYFLSNRRAAIFGMIIPALGILILSGSWQNLQNTDNQTVGKIADSFQSLQSFITSNEIRYDSIGTRQILIQRGMNELSKTYGLGVGGGASKAIGGVDVRGFVGEVPMHNFWIEVLVEGGVIFFITLLFWYLYMLVKLLFISRSNNIDQRLKYYASATFLAMCGFMVGAISTSSTIYFLPMWIMFGFSIVTINNYKRMLLTTELSQS